ncbi:MAG: hypothetical protein HOJ48_13530 [Desulfobacula sp.]|nr:hypothetical protein [Deltaproteobacteria bacterium]MBT6340307.1 hypothetical protein [Desulfobacula sp.]
MLNGSRRVSFFLIIAATFLFPLMGYAENTQVTDIAIEKSFEKILLQNKDIMLEQGAWVLPDDNNKTALIGIGVVVTNGSDDHDISILKRKGEIRARKMILELGGGIEIFVKKGSIHSGEKTSLSSFYQVTETQAEGHVKAIPRIGTWWSKDRNKFFVALGEFNTQKDETVKQVYNTNPSFLPGMEGREPYISLLKLNSDFCKNGGVRGFLLKDHTKIIMAVASSKITSSPVTARKIARLKALRFLLEQKEGTQVLSVERLVDKEALVLSDNGSQYMILSEFMSVHKEHVSGFINALPIVASWNDSGYFFIAVGSQKISKNN